MDGLDILLASLKFCGLVAATCMSILGIVVQTKKPTGNSTPVKHTYQQLNKWGWTTLYLTIFSFLVAFGAVIAEEIKSSRASEKRQEQTNRMLAQLESQSKDSSHILKNLDVQTTDLKRVVD